MTKLQCFYMLFALSVAGAVFGGSTNPGKSDKRKLLNLIFYSLVDSCH